jgi:hypothetical protein
MDTLSEQDVDSVCGGGILGEIDEAYQYAKEAAREFWRGLKDGAGLGQS